MNERQNQITKAKMWSEAMQDSIQAGAMKPYVYDELVKATNGLSPEEISAARIVPPEAYDEADIERLRTAPLCFAVTVLVEVPAETWHTWDSGCDETFGLGSIISNGDKSGACLTISEYQRVSSAFVNKNRHNIFDENGGI